MLVRFYQNMSHKLTFNLNIQQWQFVLLQGSIYDMYCRIDYLIENHFTYNKMLSQTYSEKVEQSKRIDSSSVFTNVY
jgi:hypothetical protein